MPSRTAIHEAAHCLVAHLVGFPVHGARTSGGDGDPSPGTGYAFVGMPVDPTREESESAALIYLAGGFAAGDTWRVSSRGDDAAIAKLGLDPVTLGFLSADAEALAADPLFRAATLSLAAEIDAGHGVLTARGFQAWLAEAHAARGLADIDLRTDLPGRATIEAARAAASSPPPRGPPRT